MTAASPSRPSLASAGWVLAGSGVLVAAVLGFALFGIFKGERRVGDGRDITTYGFDLSNLATPPGALVATGNPRDFLTPLDAPVIAEGSSIAPRNERERNKYSVREDRVIGLIVNGEARAYPLPLMNVHEIVHDELGGVPIAVTYSPLCDSAVVFDRRLGGATLSFGVSGLLLNNNLVFYDRATGPAPHTPSLWSQLAMGPIAGPALARGDRLTPLPGVLISTWSSWLFEHPDTTIAMPAETDWRKMKETDYRRYWHAGEPTYPVVALAEPPAMERSVPFTLITPTSAELIETAMSDMTMVIAVKADDGWRVIPLRFMETLRINADGHADTAPLGVKRMWVVVPVYGAFLVDDELPPLTVPCRWFAWNAFHPMPRP